MESLAIDATMSRTNDSARRRAPRDRRWVPSQHSGAV
jgi:hypothetical protein